MVLTVQINNKNVEFSVSEVKKYLGIVDNNFLKPDSKQYIDLTELKNNILNILQNYIYGQIKFNDKKIYNHITFYKHLGFKLVIKIEKSTKHDNKANIYKTNIYYKNILLHTSHKTIEVYFNYLVLKKLNSHPQFAYLFHNDNEFFNDDLISIDESTEKSNERFDMKIKFNNVSKSFGLECFEKHHANKHDIELNCERMRLLSKINYEKDVRFVCVFWYSDIFDKNKFNFKFDKYIVENFNLHNKIKKDYCVQQLNYCINDIELCKCIYDSYIGKLKPIISIDQINSLFEFVKGGKKKHLNDFELRLKKKYIEEMKMNKVNQNGGDKLNFLLENSSDSDSDLESDTDLDLSDEFETEKDYLKKYFDNDKLTFDGFGHYVQGLSFSDCLKFEKDKFGITDWYNKIMFALMKSFENAYDDLDKLTYGKNIFGLNEFDIEQKT